MSYLICQRCFGYYELQEDEVPEDFESCECGGFLDVMDNIEDLISRDRVSDREDLTTHFVCPNIYCNHKQPLKKGERCPKCGSTISGLGFKESMALLTNKNNIKENNIVYDIKCPNPLCGYSGIHNSPNCPECGSSIEMGETVSPPLALGLFRIKGNVEIQKEDFFKRDND